jgi:predicted tellurium resistance membrane protein TerC
MLVFTAENMLELLTLTGLEIVLGIDNIIFIALIVQRLPPAQRRSVRLIGIGLALILRVLMLTGASTIAKMQTPLFSLGSLDFSGRDLMLFGGGVFLLVKGFKEILHLFAANAQDKSKPKVYTSFWNAITQVVFIDVILSFDSVITAVGMTDHLMIMIIAITIAMAIMVISVQPISEFIRSYPNIKVIGICFVMLIGAYLTAGGLHFHIEKAYLYAAMFFSLMVESINIALKKYASKH